MTGFTYIVPDAEAFIHTLRRYLQTIGQGHIVPLLMNSTCDITTSSSFSRIRWDAYATTITFYVALENIPKFTNDVKKELFPAIDVVFPKNAGYDITEIVIAPFLESPSDDDKIPLDTFPASDGIIEYDSLKFRSQSEIRVYDVLKKRNALFFANATVVLGNKNIKREPDFLICQNGKWGILEVMGEQYHPSATAMKDHDRARLFKDYGLSFIEFYEAQKCYNEPESVVKDFLTRLSKA